VGFVREHPEQRFLLLPLMMWGFTIWLFHERAVLPLHAFRLLGFYFA
jgi:hypothetical protein